MSAARMRLMKVIAHQSSRKKQSPQLLEAAKKTKWDIVRGDKVEVVGNHPERGKQGIVKTVLRKKDRVVVEGVNFGTKFIKPNERLGLKGRTTQRERTIHYSKVNLVDPVSGKPTRIYKKFLEDGSKVRISKKSGAIIPRPEILTVRRKPISSLSSSHDDTPEEDVWAITYAPLLEVDTK